MPKGDPKDEYLDASENMRYLGNLRFAEMTVFIVTTGGLLAVLFQPDFALSNVARVVLKVGGIATALIFGLTNERVSLYWKHSQRRAAELEKELGYQQYSTLPRRSAFTAENASRLLYFLLLVFWIATLIWPAQF